MRVDAESSSTRAVELVADALREIDRYKRTKSADLLESAALSLTQALECDPKYLRAIFYDAMVNDLRGDSDQAITQYQEVLRVNPPFAEQACYQLALAHYHRYDRWNLDKAGEIFSALADKTDARLLKVLCYAGLAQVYAMRMVRPHDGISPRENAEAYFLKFEEARKKARQALKRVRDIDEHTSVAVSCTILITRAMAGMLRTDYQCGEKERIPSLKIALRYLNIAERYDDKNWAIHSDRGSVHMRLGYWSKMNKNGSGGHFETALECFRRVNNMLRPNYGAVLYDTARTYRLMGRFEDAGAYFAKTRNLPLNQRRDVSDESIERELARVKNEDLSFP